MKADAGGYRSTVIEAGESAVWAEREGYDGWWAAETQVDPFVACAVVVALARNPMTVALQANDLQVLSGGRFVLGLGSQIRPHITRRYSMDSHRVRARCGR